MSSIHDDTELLGKKSGSSVFEEDVSPSPRNFVPLQRRQTMAPGSSKEDKTRQNFDETLNNKNPILKEKLIDKIRQVQDDIEMSQSAVTDQAKEHISDNDLILTYDYSETLISFLKEAAEDI